jgi:hypothetical protein
MSASPEPAAKHELAVPMRCRGGSRHKATPAPGDRARRTIVEPAILADPHWMNTHMAKGMGRTTGVSETQPLDVGPRPHPLRVSPPCRPTRPRPRICRPGTRSPRRPPPPTQPTAPHRASPTPLVSRAPRVAGHQACPEPNRWAEEAAEHQRHHRWLPSEEIAHPKGHGEPHWR